MRTSIRRTVAIAIATMACALLAPAAASADTITLDRSDNGRAIYMYPGDQISLKLSSCEASCGYSWNTTRGPDSRIVRRYDTSIKGQTRTFKYYARKSGDTALTLSYDSPAGASERKFSVKIHVKKSFDMVLNDGKRSGLTYLASQQDRLVIRLPSCEGSCGGSWKTTIGPNNQVLSRTSSQPLKGRNYRKFVYTAVGRGTTTLQLSYFGPGSNRAQRTFRIRLEVR